MIPNILAAILGIIVFILILTVYIGVPVLVISFLIRMVKYFKTAGFKKTGKTLWCRGGAGKTVVRNAYDRETGISPNGYPNNKSGRKKR